MSVHNFWTKSAMVCVLCNLVLCLKINGSRQIEQVTFKIPIPFNSFWAFDVHTINAIEGIL